MKNKKLYESIMRDVAKAVKRHLNESNQDDITLLIEFIHDNKSFKNYEIQDALGKMEEDRIPLYHASSNINDNIYELIHEYAEDNDLSEEWEEQFDSEEIFFKFVDIYADEIWNGEDDSYDDRDAWDEYINKYGLDPGDEEDID